METGRLDMIKYLLTHETEDMTFLAIYYVACFTSDADKVLTYLLANDPTHKDTKRKQLNGSSHSEDSNTKTALKY
ncbi:hypothetical protein THRCLA_23452 [Thraustotheca clavata]|uniref:Uncharacterized protein n=1 Tax=Thraustotheca clavata TaxID=74557 RepID=A0A1V9Y4G7_9STRA|nr:hypothetical protein THRCLA_23452 [Thraustotheca clavata]